MRTRSTAAVQSRPSVAMTPNFTSTSARAQARERVEVEARLLAVHDVHDAQLASVEFSGLIREQCGVGAMPFRELWILARLPGADRMWRVARVQALA